MSKNDSKKQKNELAYLICLISKAEITSCPSVQQRIEAEGLFSGGNARKHWVTLFALPAFLSISLFLCLLGSYSQQAPRAAGSGAGSPFPSQQLSWGKPAGMSWRQSSTSHLLPWELPWDPAPAQRFPRINKQCRYWQQSCRDGGSSQFLPFGNDAIFRHVFKVCWN